MATGRRTDARTPLDLPLADTVPEATAGSSPLDGAGLEQIADEQDRFVLSVDMLLPDADGAVVLDGFAGASITLAASTAIAEQGVVAEDLQAAGQDVSGMTYVALENGVTLYYPAGADITIS